MSGTAMYTVPVYVSPGTSGMHPNISLVYSSMAGSGVMGVGWNISGLSAISRVPQNKYYDGKIQGLKYDNTDRLSLDGQRLMLISGNYLEDGSIYRTEVDNFARIYYYTTPNERFVVYSKDGKVIEYNEQVIDPGTSVSISWFITKILDANGNYIEFGYNNYYGLPVQYGYYGLPNYYQSAVLVHYIRFTGNANTGMYPYNEIWFHYDNNDAYERWYGNNHNLFSSKYRLTKIESKSGGYLVRQYDFEYDDTSSTDQYYLEKITESNIDNEFYNSTVFTWDRSIKCSDNGVEYNSGDFFGGWNDLFVDSRFGRKVTNTSSKEKMERLVGDLNGDGFSDIVVLKGNKYSWLSTMFGIINPASGYADTFSLKRIGINDGKEGFEIIDFTNNDFRLNKIISAILLDVDGDGKDELITTRRRDCAFSYDTAYIDFYKYNNKKINRYRTYKINCNNPVPIFGNYIDFNTNNKTYVILFGDVNGDGKLDLVYVRADDREFRTIINKEEHNNHSININSNYDTRTLFNVDYFYFEPRRFFLADVNGDGLADFCLFVRGNVYVYFSKGDGTFEKHINALQIKFDYSMDVEIQMLDINGDGLADIIGFPFTDSINSNEITIGLSLGDKFICKRGCGTIGRGNGFSNILKKPLQIRDVNNDGLPDIVFFSGNGVEILLNSVTDNIFPKFTSLGVQFNGLGCNSNAGSWNDSLFRRTVGDFNGDGVIDIFGFGQNELSILKGKPNYPARITAITDGFGNTTEINYNYRRNDFSNNTLQSNLLPVGPTILVSDVKKIAVGIGNIFNTNYYFGSPIFERTRKGFLGFKIVWQDDNISNVSTVTFFSLLQDNVNIIIGTIPDYSIMVPIFTTSSIGNIFSFSPFFTIHYSLYNFYDLGDKSYTILQKQIKEYNYLDNTTKIINNEYNNENDYPVINVDPSDNLNLIWQDVSYYNGTNNNAILEFKEMKRMFYDNIGFRDFKCTSDVVERFYTIDPYPSADLHRTWSDYEYDNNGNLTQVITNASFPVSSNPEILTQTINYFYNLFGNLIEKSVTDGILSRTSLYSYDSKGRFLTSATSPSGIVTTYTYDNKYGNLLSKTSPNFNGDPISTSYDYDAWGRCISTIYPDASILYYGLEWTDGSGLYYEETRKNNANGTLLNKKYYNSIGNPILNIFYSGFNGSNNIAIETKYNNKGLVNKRYGANRSYWTDFTYDKYNRLLTEIGPQLNNEYQYYDRTTKRIDHLNNDAEYTNIKNILGKTVTITDPGGFIFYEYNTLNLPIKIKCNNMITELQYDAFGNRTQIIEPNSGTTNFIYNTFYELEKQIDAENIYTYEYDTYGKLINETIENENMGTTYIDNSVSPYSAVPVVNNTGTIIYNYNNNTDLLEGVESQLPEVLHKVDFVYDELNRIITKTSTLGEDEFTFSFEYKSNTSLIETITYPTGLKINYAFNDYDEMINLSGDIPISINDPIINYTINEKNHFNQTTNSSMGYEDCLSTEYNFDIFGQIVNIRTLNKGNFIQDLNYDYDTQGHLIWKECHFTGQEETYFYDNLHRIERVLSPNNKVLDMMYSAEEGNIELKSDFGSYEYDHQRPNAVQRISTNNFSQLAETYAYYLFGNKVGKLSSYVLSNPSPYNRCNSFVFYGYDKQRIISEEHLPTFDGILIIKKYIDKYYEEEWVYKEKLNWIVIQDYPSTIYDIPVVVNPNTLSFGNFLFEGYYIPNNNNNADVPGFIRVGDFLIPFPIPEEVKIHMDSPDIIENSVRKLHYIYGEADKLIGIYTINTQFFWSNGPREEIVTDTMYYIHQDRLGSYNVITDDIGTVIERLSYDIWGNRVLDNDWSQREDFDYGDLKHIFRRGYTGHEHLGSFGIINMNGRIFDPNTATFFSPDPFVVDASSTQAFNRYSYCLNNPLMYTDPSGEFIFSLFVPVVGVFLDAACWGGLIGGASYTASIAMSSGGFSNWDSKSFWKSVGVGAISGAVTFGIGEAFQAAGNFAGKVGTEVIRGAAHGVAQGSMSALQGGNFWQGFASGGLSSLAGSAFQMYGGSFAKSTAGMYAFSGVAGGLGSVFTGGNFFEGAATGLMVAGLNHLKHGFTSWANSKMMAKLAAHYETGGKKDFLFNDGDLDFSFTSRKQLGIPDNLKPGDPWSVNLFDAGVNELSLSFGKVDLIYQGNNQFTMTDYFDFNYEKGGTFARNAGTFVGGAVFRTIYGVPIPAPPPFSIFRPNVFRGGPFNVRGTVTIR